jgi:predicted small secreted protein
VTRHCNGQELYPVVFVRERTFLELKMMRSSRVFQRAAAVAAVALLAGLSACNTLNGAGQDVSAIGHDVSRGAAAGTNAVANTGASTK